MTELQEPKTLVNACASTLPPKRRNSSAEECPETRHPKRRRYNFSLEYIEHFLYGYNDVKDKLKENLNRPQGHPRDCCCECCVKNGMLTTKRDPLNSLKKFVNGDKTKPQSKLSYALASFPDEVELRPSSLPGLKQGVFAKVPIAVGTWIGPFEGRHVKPEDITNNNLIDTSFIWEIFDKGHLVGFLDASNEEESSWMRFIRCARHSWEQNLYLFQHNGEIYYRAFRDIPPGAELLVWYDVTYSHHFGIPFGLDSTHDVKHTGGTNEKTVPQVPKEFPYPSSKLGHTSTPKKDWSRSPTVVENPKLMNYFSNNPVLFCENRVQAKGRFTPYVQEGHGAAVESLRVHKFPALAHVTQLPQKKSRDLEVSPQPLQTAASVKEYNICVVESPLIGERAKHRVEPFVDAKRDEEFEMFRRDLKMKLQRKREQRREREEEETKNHSVQESSQKQSSHTTDTSENKAPVKNEPTAPQLEKEKIHTVRETHPMTKIQVSPIHPVQFPEPLTQTEDVGMNGVSVHDTPPQSPDGKYPLKHEYLVLKAQVHDEKISVHTNETPSSESNVWKCGQCKKTFSQRTTLQVHVCTRNPDKPYQCGHCYLSFAKPGALKNHVITHANEKPFQCGFCSRAFSGATTLNNHIRTHTGEKPFSCEKCGKFFSQASQLSRHQRIPSDCVV